MAVGMHADDDPAGSSGSTAGNDLMRSDDSARSIIATSPSKYPVNHIQLFAGLIEGQYRKGAYAAPGPAHTISFLHYVAAQDVALPLLRNATDTLCLAHLSNRSGDVRVARASQDSQRRLLSLLHRAVAHSTSPKPFCTHRDVIASILMLSLAPSTTVPDEQQQDSLSPALIHLNGVMKYLEAHGPMALDEKEPLDYRLLCHVRLLGVFQHLRWRKRVLWDRPEWREVGSIPLSYAPRTVMSDFVTRLPGVLEQADAFMAAEIGPSVQTQAKGAPLIRTLDELQIKLVGPWLAGPTITKPSVLFASDLGVGLGAMEQPFGACDGYCFGAIYDFTKPTHGFVNAYVRFMCLIADCTLLRVLHHVDAQRGSYCGAFTVRAEDVEERAYFQATELCRYAQFFSRRRSLPAASFLDSMIEGAPNFFECFGAQEEAEWCKACLASNQTRRESLRRDLPPSICPVGELMAGVADSCRYSRPIAGTRRTEEEASVRRVLPQR